MKHRVLVAAPLLILVAGVLSGCALASAINPPIDSAIYATVDDAKGAKSTVALPDWVQPDASMIRIKTSLVDNSTILSYSVPQPSLPEGSDPAAPPPAVAPIGEACTSASEPSLDDTWWLQSMPTDAAITCSGGWHILIQGLTIFAWNP